MVDRMQCSCPLLQYLDFFHCIAILLNTIPPPTHRSIQAVQIEYSKLTFGTLRVLLQSQADLESAL